MLTPAREQEIRFNLGLIDLPEDRDQADVAIADLLEELDRVRKILTQVREIITHHGCIVTFQPTLASQGEMTAQAKDVMLELLEAVK